MRLNATTKMRYKNRLMKKSAADAIAQAEKLKTAQADATAQAKQP